MCRKCHFHARKISLQWEGDAPSYSLALALLLKISGYASGHIHFCQLIYLQSKIMKRKRKNDRKIFATFDHNFNNVLLGMCSEPMYYYFVLYDSDLTLKLSKWFLSVFAYKLFISKKCIIAWFIVCIACITHKNFVLLGKF